MARADLLVNLVRAGSRGDPTLFRSTVEALVAEERAKQHHVLAEKLEECLRNGSAFISGIARTSPSIISSKVAELLHEVTPHRTLEDLILPEVVVEACNQVIEEHHRRDLLRSYNLEPRHRILLVGPPGNGKTSLAHALASEMMLPLFVVRYEGIIGSYLGETASRVSRLFEYVRTHPCVVFMDEFETLAKERGDTHETGEIKRVVSSLLLHIDDLPSHVVIITATNHDELLDRAVWRRFQLRLELPAPSRSLLQRWFEAFAERQSEPLGYAPRTLAEKLAGRSFADVEQFALDVLRRHVLALPNSDLKSLIQERLKLEKNLVRQSKNKIDP
jgi:SpoVK/Ycf46/Vps4 family AAA+-type ATPase